MTTDNPHDAETQTERDTSWPPAECCQEFYRCYCGADPNPHRIPRASKATYDPDFPNACNCAWCEEIGERRGWQYAPLPPPFWTPSPRFNGALPEIEGREDGEAE